jgi:hypothetical protein
VDSATLMDGGRCSPTVPPKRLVEAYEGARKIVEVGCGTHFEDALALAHALPGVRVVVTDIDGRVRDAPPPLEGVVDDVRRPRPDLYDGAALVYAVRLPEELHASLARAAQAVGADLALRLLGDEVPELSGWGRPEVLADRSGPWRWWRR